MHAKLPVDRQKIYTKSPHTKIMSSDNENRDLGKSGTQTIHRCAALLRLITTHQRTGLRLVDLYQSVKLTRPTTHRILQALVAEGFVRQDERSKRYFLGSLVYEMGMAAAPPLDLRDICQPFLQRIAVETGDTVFLTIRSGLDGVCIARAEGAYPVKVFVLDVGRRRPLNIGGGSQAYLSALPDDEIERIWLANRDRVIAGFPRFDLNRMWQRIAQARCDGYLMSDVIEIADVSSMAVPILGVAGRPLGALSISALRSRFSGTALGNKANVLRDAVQAIQAKLASEVSEPTAFDF
jgi:DNA-binding IclR family transcriptional regulator